jgi:hypothetical protein
VASCSACAGKTAKPTGGVQAANRNTCVVASAAACFGQLDGTGANKQAFCPAYTSVSKHCAVTKGTATQEAVAATACSAQTYFLH